jgi:hypothetical protein
MLPPIQSNFNALPSGYDDRFRSLTQPAGKGRGAGLRGWRKSCLHQHHRGRGIALRSRQERLTATLIPVRRGAGGAGSLALRSSSGSQSPE